MKLKYSIISIDSTADDIYVNSYGQNVFEFHKKDFDNDWKNIIGQEFELDPCAVADLSKLEMYGNEAHTVQYTLEDKYNWFNFARNKLRDDFFTNTERVAELTKDNVIEIYNKDTINSLTQFCTLVKNIPLFGDVGVDLSTLTISEEFLDSYPQTGKLTDGGKSIKAEWLITPSGYRGYQKIIKMPQLPKNLKSAYGLFYGFSKLKDISNLDFSNIIEYNDTFHSTPIIDASNVSLARAKSIYRIFYGCSELEYLPPLILEDATSIEGIVFYDNTSINTKTIHLCSDIKILQDTAVIKDSLFTKCCLDNVKDISINANLLKPIFYETSITDGIIGNIYVKSCNETSSSSNNAFHLIYGYPSNSTSYRKSTIETIGDVHIGEIKNTQVIIDGFSKKIGNVTVDTGNGANSTINVSCIGDIGNISVDNIRLVTNCKNLGVVNATRLISNSQISAYNAIAVPYYLNGCSYSLPSSSGYKYWVDYVKTETAGTKSIHTGTVDISTHLKINSNKYKGIVEIPTLFQLNPDYPYDFELVSYTLYKTDYNFDVYPTKNNITVKNSKLVLTDENAIGLDLELEDIQDGSSISVNFDYSYLNIVYNAIINGAPFTGRAHVVIKGTIDFEVDEDISSNFHIEYEEGEEPLPTE